MVDQERLDDFLEALEQAGSPASNGTLRKALGWEEGEYEAVKHELVARRIVTRGRGRSDTVSLVGVEPVGRPATAPSNGARPASKSRGRAASANGKGKDKSLESWIWEAACSIRGAKRRNIRTTSCR